MTRHVGVWGKYIQVSLMRITINVLRGPYPRTCSYWDLKVLAPARVILSLFVIWRPGKHQEPWLQVVTGLCRHKLWSQTNWGLYSVPAMFKAQLSQSPKPYFLTCKMLVVTQVVLPEPLLAKPLVVSFLFFMREVSLSSSSWLRRQSTFTERPAQGTFMNGPVRTSEVSFATVHLTAPAFLQRHFLFILCFQVSVLIETPQN